MLIKTLWNTPVELDLKEETFPTEEEIKAMDELVFSPDHGFYEGSHGSKLHYLKWLPVGEPKGVCVYQHGIQGHCALSCKVNGELFKVACMVKSIRESGYILYSLDMLGHGFSEGERFYIPKADWTLNRDDLADFAQYASSEYTTLPLFLLAESYGACLSIHVARQWMDAPDDAPSSFKGICLLAPAIIVDLPPKLVLDFLIFLAGIIPTSTPFFMPNPISADRIWNNEEVAKEFSSEKRKEMQLSAGGLKLCLGTALGVVNAMEKVREEAIQGLSVPFYVGHGTNDFGVPIAGTEYLLEHSATPEDDRCVNIVEGGYHDLLSSEMREKVIGSMIEWMDSRI